MFSRKKLNQCANCGQWAGGSHRCPVSSPTDRTPSSRRAPRWTDHHTNPYEKELSSRVGRAQGWLERRAAVRERQAALTEQIDDLYGSADGLAAMQPGLYKDRLTQKANAAADAVAQWVNNPTDENLSQAREVTWDAYHAIRAETEGRNDARHGAGHVVSAISRLTTEVESASAHLGPRTTASYESTTPNPATHLPTDPQARADQVWTQYMKYRASAYADRDRTYEDAGAHAHLVPPLQDFEAHESATIAMFNDNDYTWDDVTLVSDTAEREGLTGGSRLFKGPNPYANV